MRSAKTDRHDNRFGTSSKKETVMNIILLGAPGAGKGTQASKIADTYGLPHISTGDIFRENIKNQTEIGLLAKSYIDKGQLVPDEVTCKIVEERIARDDCKNGYMLDGFPRTIAQAEALDKIADIQMVINIDVDLSALSERLCGRRTCPKCGESYHVSTKKDDKCDKCGEKLIQRKDDMPETINNRLQVYTTATAPLIEYYQKQGKLITVDGMKSIDEVYAQIEKALSK